jgi:hypothetical protein
VPRAFAARVCLLGVLAVTACNRGSDLPLGIGDVAWPTDAVGFAEVIAGLPDEIDGLPRLEGGILVATYGESQDDPSLRIWAEDLGGAECPGLNGVSLLRSTLERDGALTISESSPDDAEDPSYLLGTLDERSVAAWTVPECAWVVVVEAPTPSSRDAAVEATVASASG